MGVLVLLATLGCPVVLARSSHNPKWFWPSAVIYPQVAEAAFVNQALPKVGGRSVFTIAAEPKKSTTCQNLRSALEADIPAGFERCFRTNYCTLWESVVFLKRASRIICVRIWDRFAIFANKQSDFLLNDSGGRFSEILEIKRDARNAHVSRVGKNRVFNFREFLGYGYEQPRALGVYDSLGIQVGGICRALSCFGLSNEHEKRTYSDDDSNNASIEKANVGEIFWPKQSLEIALRLIYGPIDLGIGCFLIYWGYDRDRWGDCVWFFRFFGVVSLVVGLGCFFLPMYWQDQRDHDCEQELFHALVSQAALFQNTGSIPSSCVS
jgi:hypothetical protein